jgi:hypothetical protein
MKGKISLKELLNGVTNFIMRGHGIRCETTAALDKIEHRMEKLS